MQCHQPNGPGTKKMLRFQEMSAGWLHWFYEEVPENLALIQDFQRAHGSESYGGVPANLVRPSRPIVLETLLKNNGFGTQPNLFDTKIIQAEVKTSGQSATWNGLYAKAVAGTEIAVPYHEAAHTDPAKVNAAVAAYQKVINGTLARDQLPDIRDVVLDSALSDLSYRPKAGLDGRGIMVHLCQHCHNSRLDQSLSRARFNVEQLDSLSRPEKDEAIRRLMLPDDNAQKMPPPQFHSLSDSERDLVVQELSN
jgi:hypothetical protein